MQSLYVHAASPVHRLNFWTKFLALLLFLPLAAFLAKPVFMLLLAGVLAAMLVLSRIGVGKFWRLARLYVISISFGVVVLSLLFSPGQLQERLLVGAVLAARFALLISFGMLFSAVTNPIEIPTGFLQARLPHKYGITLMVGLRMMPLLAGKIQTVIDAQKARGASFRLTPWKLPQLASRFAALLVPILHFTLETSVQLSDTLISRGYNPEGRITRPPLKLSWLDASLFTGALLLAAFSSLMV